MRSRRSFVKTGRLASIPRVNRTVAAGMLALAVLRGHPAGAASPPALAWQVVSHDTPDDRLANRTRLVPIRLRNVGTATWSPATDGLSYHILAPDGTMVERDACAPTSRGPVPPGEVELRARLRRPPRPARYIVEWEMVREQVRWYGSPTGGGCAEGSVPGGVALLVARGPASLC